MELRASPAEKALLTRAAALERLDVTTFVLRAALPKARSVISAAERVELSERDSLLVLALLDDPPQPSEKLMKAAKRRLRGA